MAGHCVVIVREVWDTRDLVGPVLDENGRLKAGALQTRFEPEDLNALEAALRLKDSQGVRVTALTVGAPRQVEVLRECLYRGADEAIQIDADPWGLDDTALATLLAGAVRKMGAVDLALVGTNVVDGENAMLGPILAAELGWEQVAWVDAIEALTDDRVTVKRAIEMGYETLEAPLPAVISIGVALLEDDPRAPRPAKAMLKLKLKKTPLPTWSVADVGAADPAASMTVRVVSREPVPERVIESRTVDADDPAALKALLDEVLKGR